MNKIQAACSRIHEAYTKFGGALFLGHSGGKDSCVIHQLANTVASNLLIVHTPKPSTHPKTVEFLYNLAVSNTIMMVPSDKMEAFVASHSLRCQIDGTRIDEANRKDGRSTTFVQNNVNKSRTEMSHFVENGLFGLSMVYPIFDWTDDEVFDYIKSHNIPLSEEYVLVF